MNRGEREDRRRIEGEMVGHAASRDVVVQAVIGVREDLQLFAEIEDIRRETRNNEKEDDETEYFSFVERNKMVHE